MGMFQALGVVLPARNGIIQRLIGKQQDAHTLVGIFPLVQVGMILQRQFLERGLNRLGRCIRSDPQNSVIISKRVHVYA